MIGNAARIFIAVIALHIGGVGLRGAAADNIPNRVYEMRTYVASEGNLDEMRLRFRNHATRYMLMHGMQLVGYWTPVEGTGPDNSFVMLVSHESHDAAREAWASLAGDPDWTGIWQSGEGNEPIIKETRILLMKAADFSPMK